MIRKISLAIIGLSLVTSCVSKKVYTELEDRYARLKKENRKLSDSKNDLEKEREELTTQLADANKELEQLRSDKATLSTQLAEAQSKYDQLKKSYDALEKNSSSALARNAKQNRDLLKQLEDKQKALNEEHNRLTSLQRELDARSKRADDLESALAARSKRVSELEKVLADKEASMKRLKEAISKALTNFEGKGLTVEQRDGKVYVSMENKLLFKSGSWEVGVEGKKAVQQLGAVLAENPEINVLIEGHTDNDPFNGKGDLKDNWDLSTKRATAIVNILTQVKNIKVANLTAAGRSEFAPIADNATVEGKAKNRRIEVVLTPKLDEVSKLLNDVQ